MISIVLGEPEEIPPKGASVSAVYDNNGKLIVSGELSDNPKADGTVLLAVYNNDKRMIAFKV